MSTPASQKAVSTTLEGLQHLQGEVAMLGFQFPKGIPALFFLASLTSVLSLFQCEDFEFTVVNAGLV